MKRTTTLSLIVALSASILAIAQFGGMNGTDITQQSKSTSAVAHQALAVVKNVDAANGKVTLAHEPIKSLGWPAMTMGFTVKDKTLFAKLVLGREANVEIVQQGGDYVVTAVR